MRLKKRQDFLETAAKGRKWVTKSFVIQILESSSHLETSLIGFTASKRVGNAVYRNRAKRRMRALIDNNLSLIEKQSPHKIVLIAREEIFNISFEQLNKDFRWAWRRLFEGNKT